MTPCCENVWHGQKDRILFSLVIWLFQTLGNHEFDEGIPGLLNFLQDFPIPVVCSNMNSDKVPLLKPLYTSSHVINVGGRNIGVIGYITEEMPELIVAGICYSVIQLAIFLFYTMVIHSKKKSTSEYLFWCVRLSQIKDSIQYLEGPNSTWKDHFMKLGVLPGTI